MECSAMIRLVTDSSSDLPVSLAQTHGIRVVPLTIRFGDQEFVDGRDLTTDQFWEKLASSSSLPETAAPSAGAFLETFEALASDGADGVVVVTLSAAISATYQAAVIGAEQASIPVRVVDSRQASAATALQVLAGVGVAERGGDLDECVTAVDRARDRVSLVAALDTLEYLKRGGRIGGAAAMVGGLLDVKPLITFVDGAVATAGRVRTRSKAIAALIDRVRQAGPDIESVAVMHAQASDAQELAAGIIEAFPSLSPIITDIGPVIGTHAGPGTVGVAVLTA
jgi:DegV family protein with EDD domain